MYRTLGGGSATCLRSTAVRHVQQRIAMVTLGTASLEHRGFRPHPSTAEASRIYPNFLGLAAFAVSL